MWSAVAAGESGGMEPDCVVALLPRPAIPALDNPHSGRNRNKNPWL